MNERLDKHLDQFMALVDPLNWVLDLLLKDGVGLSNYIPTVIHKYTHIFNNLFLLFLF